MSGQMDALDRQQDSSVSDSGLRANIRKRRPDSALFLSLSDNNNLSQSVPSSLSSQTISDPFFGEDEITSRKRRRYDSSISTLSDESDSQLSTSSDVSPHTKFYKLHHEPFNNGDIIGEFKIVGSGYEAKAIHSGNNTVYDCRILSEYEAETLSKLLSRLDEAHLFYSNSDIDTLRNMIVPDDACLIEDSKDRFIYFSLPLAHGKTLHSYAELRGSEMTELDIQPIFEQIIRVVAFCHRIGIIVRELKPKKLGLSKDGRVRLNQPWDLLVLDSPQSDIIKEKFKGSPAYAPPEVLSTSDEGYSGRAADMWGLGVLLYLLLLGRYPFYDRTPVGVFQKIVQARVVVPANAVITKHVRILLFCLLRKRPIDRPSAEDLRYVDWVGAQAIPSRSYCVNRVTANMMYEIQTDIRVGSTRNLDPTAVRDIRERADQSQLSPVMRLGVLHSLFQRASTTYDQHSDRLRLF